ncbi:RNA 2',3'-cyclic phosphodiesterase [Streptomyces sp. V4-01]|uniref:RNA 2',3'-cyclic phosphodiesterase n=1 Tax=Actinacidiphila polyblastidii TaxID=3110430 RepID=A0ABU7PI13_9ACTN|nr:RNA 2',3'-cyclic phosphodiesterase [Streptomyces sp. V4-01]
MRLFVALLPAPAAAGELAAALRPLHRLPDAGALRWTAPESWHFTLAFLGEVPDHVRPDLDLRLERAAHRHGPHDLRLAGAGRFGDHVLWAGAEGDTTALGRLADSVRAAARRAGAPPDEERGFRPHLTLARAQRSRPVRLRPLADALAGFRGSPWSADTLCLVGSVLPRSGVPGEQPRYDAVASWPLGGEHPPGGPDDGPAGTAG